MKYLVLLSLFMFGACDELQVQAPDAYQLTVEEVAYMVGCLEMGERQHVPKAATVCADMNEAFMKRHKRPGER